MAENERVLFVVNPISGGIDKSAIISELRKELEKGRNILEIYYTSGKNDTEKLAETLRNFKPDRILIAGGDGTIKLIAEILKEDAIPVGILPFGSANGLAENLNIPAGNTEMIKVALGNHFVNVDCIIINNEICLHIGDLGLNAALIKNYDEGNIRGKLGYLIQSIPTLIESDFPFEFEIKIEGEIYHRKAFLVAIANARKYGTGANINPKGKFNDGKFEVLIFKKFDIPEILKTFQENVNPNCDFLEIFSTHAATISCNKEIPFQIDGEYRGKTSTAHAQISPTQIKMAVPPDFNFS